MAVLAKDIALRYRAPAGGLITISRPMAGYTNYVGGSVNNVVYKGAIMVCDVSDTDGYFSAVPLVSTTNMAAGDIFGGIAMEYQISDSDSAADGAVEVTCAQNGIWGFAVASLAITDMGAPIYASDDQTVTTTSTNALLIGYLTDWDAAYAWVDISKQAGLLNAVIQ